MSNKDMLEFLLPPGRLVWGDLYNGNTTDMDNRPLVYKTGAKMGQPRVDFAFGLAIPKSPNGQHWANEEWGKKLWEFGHRVFPQGQAQSPAFAWKITDGDSTVPTAKGNLPCNLPGHKGHWVLRLSSTVPVRLYTMGPSGVIPFAEPGAVMPGDWVEAYVQITSNEQVAKPGLYINHSMVCWRGYDPAGRIQLGPDPSKANFGGAAMPAGVSQVPVGNVLATPPAPGAPAGAQPPAPAPSMGPPAPPVATVASTQPPPHTGILQPPGAPPAPGVPTVPPVPTGPVMLPKANGTPYESFRVVGWTDDQLRQQGYMQ